MVTDGNRRFNKPVLPFIAFGLFMGLAGLLSHKPISPAVSFIESVHQAHSLLASLAGISITIGLLWQVVLVSTFWSRAIIITLATLSVMLPLCMLAFQDVQGLIQHFIYFFVFIWLWADYPFTIMINKKPEESL